MKCHKENDSKICDACGQLWPCPTALRLAGDAVDRALAEDAVSRALHDDDSSDEL